MTEMQSEVNTFLTQKMEEDKAAASTQSDAKKAKEKPQSAEAENMVPLGVRCAEDYRRELKIYAATIGKSMQDVVLEGIELHRQKHGKQRCLIALARLERPRLCDHFPTLGDSRYHLGLHIVSVQARA